MKKKNFISIKVFEYFVFFFTNFFIDLHRFNGECIGYMVKGWKDIQTNKVIIGQIRSKNGD